MESPFLNFFRSKIETAIALLILLLFIGVVGFRVMSNYSWVDAIFTSMYNLFCLDIQNICIYWYLVRHEAILHL